MKLFLILFTISFSAYANLPPIESLFRNGSNKDLNKTAILFKFAIEEKKLGFGEMKESEVSSEQIDAEIKAQDQETIKKYVKMYFYDEGEQNYRFIQAIYNDRNMSSASLESVVTKYNYINFLKFKKEIDIDHDIFYSILTTLLLNNSESFSYLFKKLKISYKDNKYLLNQEKLKLLQNYKEYLQAIKDDKNLENSLVSPLKPVNPDEREKVNTIMKENMYKQSDNVSLRKVNNDFMINVDLGDFIFNFSNKAHKLKDLSFKRGDLDINVVLENYILFNGTHELPKIISFKSSDGKVFLVRPINLVHFSHNKNAYQTKTKEYRTNFKKAGSSEKSMSRVSFLYY